MVRYVFRKGQPEHSIVEFLKRGKVEREAASCLPQQRLCTVSILDACRMDADGQQQAERIGQDVALAAKHLLASVIAGRVERSPPLTAPFAVWLSMIAVVGLASRPACSRTST